MFGLAEMIERETHRQVLLEIKCEWSSPRLEMEEILIIQCIQKVKFCL